MHAGVGGFDRSQGESSGLTVEEFLENVEEDSSGLTWLVRRSTLKEALERIAKVLPADTVKFAS